MNTSFVHYRSLYVGTEKLLGGEWVPDPMVTVSDDDGQFEVPFFTVKTMRVFSIRLYQPSWSLLFRHDDIISGKKKCWYYIFSNIVAGSNQNAIKNNNTNDSIVLLDTIPHPYTVSNAQRYFINISFFFFLNNIRRISVKFLRREFINVNVSR